MKIYDIYSDKKKDYSKYVILIRVGNFYETYGEDTFLMNNLFDYKIKVVGGVNRVGFPIIAYNKVTDKFKHFKINYLVIEGVNIIKKKFNDNNYDKYVKCDDSISVRVNRICEKLKVLKDTSKINIILDAIEEIIWRII